MVTKGKGESQKTLKIWHFQAIDLSSSLVYRSHAEVQETLDFRYFFAFSVIPVFVPVKAFLRHDGLCGQRSMQGT